MIQTSQVGVSEASSEAMNVVAEQRKMLEEIKADAARLGQKDATKDDHFLQVIGNDLCDNSTQWGGYVVIAPS